MRWMLSRGFKLWIGLGALLLAGPGWVRAQGGPGEAVIAFSRATFSASEHEGSAVIVVERKGNTNAAASADLATADGTAVAGRDYTARRLAVSFAAGQTEARISVPVQDDFTAAGSKRVRLTLGNPSAGAVLGTPSAAELEIVDAGSQKAAWMSFGLHQVSGLRRTLFDIPLWQYLASLIFLVVAFYVAKLFDWLIYTQLKRWVQHTKTTLDDLLLELLRGPIKVVLLVILLHIGLDIFSWPAWFNGFLSKALKIVVACSITYMALKVIDLLVGYWRQRATEADKSFKDQMLPIIRNSAKVFVVIVAILVTLQNLGLNITGLIASLSIGGLALSLAAQDTLANLFGAVAVLSDQPFKVGDRIQLDGVDGTVEAIGLRSTRVRNLDGHLVTIPNKTVGNATITNVTLRPSIKTVMNLGVTYDTPADQVQRAVRLLEEIYRAHPKTADLVISFNQFGDSALNIQVAHWWNGADNKEYLAGMQELNLAIKQRFDAEGIGFAFPSRTLYVKQDPEWRVGGAAAPKSG